MSEPSPLSKQQRELLTCHEPLRAELVLVAGEAVVRRALADVVGAHELLRAELVAIPGRTHPGVYVASDGMRWSTTLAAEGSATRMTLLAPAWLADEESVRIVVRDVRAALAGPLDPRPSYLAYAAAQRTQDHAAHAALWARHGDKHALLPELSPLPPELEAVAETTLADATLAHVAATARALAISEEAVFLAAWLFLLRRFGNDGARRIDFVDEGRTRELTGVVGPVARVLPFAVPEDAPMFGALAQRVAEELAAVRRHRETAPERPAGPRFVFAYRPASDLAVTGGPLTGVRGITIAGRTVRLEGANVLSLYVGLLDALAPDATTLPLGEAHRRWLLDRGTGPAVTPAPPSVIARFREVVARAADRIAVRAGSHEITYGTLATETDRVAGALAALGVQPDDRVAILMPRCCELPAAVLGVLAAGAAFVPIDPSHPADRVAYLLEDAMPRAVLVVDPAIAPAGVTAIDVRALPGAAVAPVPIADGSLAYVMYTSGSTGRPKGVMVTHAGLANYIQFASVAYSVGDADAPCHTSIGFDLSVTSFLLPLATGGTVTLVVEDNGAIGLMRLLQQRPRFDLVKLTPSHLALLRQSGGLADLCRSAKTLVVGGEQLTVDLAEAVLRQPAPPALFNEYGPTETVVGCTVYCARTGEPGEAVPIGRPIPGMSVYVLDERRALALPGAVGELYIGGVAVARGYWNRDELTAERFMPDPFAASPARMYRTGDLVRWSASGDLVFLGRRDTQVKLHGYRTELEEIRSCLLEHVEDAAVVVRGSDVGPELVAYVVARGNVAADDLRAALAKRLPEYMVPFTVVALSSLPLTPSGKLDAAALPAPPPARRSGVRAYVPPRTELERQIAEIWRAVTKVDQVGVHDSFFDLGGDSVRLVLSVFRINQALASALTPTDVFARPTVAEVASLIESGGNASASAGADEAERRGRLRRALAGRGRGGAGK